MLVLTRQVGQSTFIGEGADRIVVTVEAIIGNRIQLSIQAAPHIPIVRSELRGRK